MQYITRALPPHCQKGRPRAEGSWLQVRQLLPQRQLLAPLQVRLHSGRTFSQERMQTTRCGLLDLEYSRPRNIWWDSQLTALWPRQPLDRWQNKCFGSNWTMPCSPLLSWSTDSSSRELQEYSMSTALQAAFPWGAPTPSSWLREPTEQSSVARWPQLLEDDDESFVFVIFYRHICRSFFYICNYICNIQHLSVFRLMALVFVIKKTNGYKCKRNLVSKSYKSDKL